VLTDTVTVNYSIDLRLVSDLVGAPVDEIEALNPSLLHMETPAESPYDLHLPAGTAALFDQRVEAIPEGRRNSWRYHALTADDTLASVAHEYRVQPEELAAANQMSESASLQSVEALVVPVAPEATPAAHTVMYTVRRGDTLVTIADRFGVSLAQLRQWNSLTGTRVEPGKRIHVAEPAPVRRVAASEARRRPARSASAGDPKTAGTQKSGAKTGEKTGTRSKSRVSHKRSDAAKSTQQK
jgi:membrane-bound lytic murein transglycosylase D